MKVKNYKNTHYIGQNLKRIQPYFRYSLSLDTPVFIPSTDLRSTN